VSIEKNIEILNYNLVQYFKLQFGTILKYTTKKYNYEHTTVFLYFILVSKVSTHCVETHCRNYYPIISLKNM
jgi:hypothetical protein